MINICFDGQNVFVTNLTNKHVSLEYTYTKEQFLAKFGFDITVDPDAKSYIYEPELQKYTKNADRESGNTFFDSPQEDDVLKFFDDNAAYIEHETVKEILTGHEYDENSDTWNLSIEETEKQQNFEREQKENAVVDARLRLDAAIAEGIETERFTKKLEEARYKNI